uniref:Uncharacterized protein n=1 Tax=Drosophila melanogaster TaxID=7227 RepID=Q7KUI9_DROME|nr:uncharacterized protein Dmel_CG33262 [Drosophila melanogaster]AAS65013.2 uncharacterized protein Dmel_CG33262 [Drosophila melanogaster]|eukprot:NP_996071.2 uncharacterized protein Dmel_CG33262 [Drosophila melanogaster]
MNRSMWLSVCATLCLIFLQEVASQDVHSRSKRFLIFPRQAPTRHQFIAGIGIPADLEYESLTVGYVLKAEYYLPYNATVYRQNPLFPEYKPNTIDAQDQRKLFMKPTDLRWQLYQFIEHMLNGYGLNGHACLLEAICEANNIKFAKDFSTAGEMLHLLLSPSSTLNSESNRALDFILAEKDGSRRDCSKYDCNTKIINWFSFVNKMNF